MIDKADAWSNLKNQYAIQAGPCPHYFLPV